MEGAARRVVAFLSGCMMVLLAGTFTVVPLIAMAHARGARSELAVAWLALSGLVRRVTLRSLIAAAFLAPLVWGYWHATWGDAPRGLSRDALRDLLGLEFLLVHGFPFFVLAASLARSGDAWSRRVSLGCLGLLLLLYSAFAWGMGHWAGIAGLLYLLLPNIAAFVRQTDDWTTRATAVSRWILKFVALMGIAILLDERDMQAPGIVTVGFWYFGLMGLLELFRVIDLPVDLGNIWAKLPADVRRRVKLPQPN
jgi:hypothetical protein